ncbi:putative N-carbamoyl-D-amino acid hydrolase [Candidatus Sulfobium mesophilum]|uniref:Putative N-carbamoyl-D-amino acid hydrolase n=1 Tax=Candidatus Sulfobium mesophilum TaxID=2016548 RepID=A0A2U3QG96_9BACT|nr:putative N-carbamoyl-D-amino acid hydrolase [Candidatus Sulfobium mesophilum]
MIAGFLQFDPVFGDIEGNVSRVLQIVSDKQVALVVLPELFSTGYQFVSKDEVSSLSEEIPAGFTTKRLVELSKDKKLYVVAGIAERDSGSFYNSAVLTGPEGFIGVYRKIHLFSEEKLWFSPGNSGFKVWDTAVGKIGIMICFDWLFPESARTLALKGADVIAHPANLVLPYCPDAMPTRCLENRVFAVTANRTGSEERGGKERLEFIGTSEIVSPAGEILYRAARDSEEFGLAELDISQARNKNLNAFNNLLEDRRKEFYTS